MNAKFRQSGFTLIEAIIAFLVLCIGLLGAAMFQSYLVEQSGDSKSRAYALKLAEQRLDDLRGITSLDDFDAIASLASNSASGSNANYEIRQTVSDAGSNFKRVNIDVSWNSGEDSVRLISELLWMPVTNIVDAEDAGSAGGSSNFGSIKMPTGTATALDRRVTMSNPDGVGIGGVVTSGATAGVVVENEDGTTQAYQLISLSDSNTVMEIDGRIINYPVKPVADELFVVYSPDNESEYVDLLATAGANCLVYRTDTETYSGTDYKFSDYKCLMGEGWRGTINLIKNHIDNVIEWDSSELVCEPQGRTYQYRIIDEFPDGFNLSASSANDLNVVGLSGLVRFAEEVSGATRSLDDVYLSDYFWINPNVVSSGNSSLFGNIELQSYILGTSGNGNNALSCDDIYASAFAQGYDSQYIAFDEMPGVVGDERYNAVDPDYPDQRGIVILGYTVIRTTISGKLFLSSSFVSDDSKNPLNYTIVGNPLPDVSIICNVDETSGVTTSVSGETGQSYPYSCQVPIGWEGYLTAEPNTTETMVGCPNIQGDGTTYSGDPINDDFAFYWVGSASTATGTSEVSGKNFNFGTSNLCGEL